MPRTSIPLRLLLARRACGDQTLPFAGMTGHTLESDLIALEEACVSRGTNKYDAQWGYAPRDFAMKFPKAITTYCPKCKSHTEHGVSVYKKGKERALSAGARRHEREKHGYGGQKWPELKRTAKTTKKQLLRLTCRKCNQTVYRLGIRLRKLEVGA